MLTLVLDTGALIALDRGNRAVWATLSDAARDRLVVLVPVGALAQA